MIASFDLHSIKDTQKLKTQFLEEVKLKYLKKMVESNQTDIFIKYGIEI